MQTPAEATDALVARVRDAARTATPEGLKAAFMRVLAEMEVEPGDPAWTDGRDVIGTAYEQLVAGHTRRRLGQFFTPLKLARLMARWVLEDEPHLLLDAGCGAGSLLIASSQLRAPSTRLLGIDIDASAIEMAAKNRALRRISNLELGVSDFLIEDLDARPSAIICNPPYTRHQALSADRKRAIHEHLTAALGLRFSHLASLHVLFLARALDIAAEEARLAFVTPSHWLDMGYAREVKRLLLARAHVEAIISFPTDQPVFDHALTTASITLIRKGSKPADTRIIRARSASADDLADKLADPDVGELVRLSTESKWSRAARTRVRPTSTGPRLEEVAIVRRGVATGFNEFFVLSEQRRRELGIRRSSVRACLASPRYFAGASITLAMLETLSPTVPRWLLSPTRPRATGPLADYLRLGIDEFGVRDRHIVKQREQAGRPWYQVEADFLAPILFTYFNRHAARFVQNAASGIPLNTWLAIIPAPGIDPDDLLALLRSQDMTDKLREDRRVYGNSLWKLEPSELRQIQLPREPRRVAAFLT